MEKKYPFLIKGNDAFGEHEYPSEVRKIPLQSVLHSSTKLKL